MNHVIIDYDVGNLASLQSGFKRAGLKTIITKDLKEIEAATSLILPGVGAFAPAMESLKSHGFIEAILRHVKSGKPLLGICLGMQLLYETSFEYGTHEGLGILKGTIEPIKDAPKLPHMGWNDLTFHQESPLLSKIPNQAYVYFVHSYYAHTDQTDWVATTDYGVEIPAIVQKNNVVGMQFHPEKSAIVGEQLLKNYGEVVDGYIALHGSV